MNSKVILAMVIALAMVGLTGLASAGSTMDYVVDFNAVGTGSVQIQTSTPVGTDIQIANWVNCDTVGTQTGSYNDGTWARIDRNTMITGVENGNVAYGSIVTQSMPTTPVTDINKSARVTTVATYYDNSAYGSYVLLDQAARLFDGDMPVIDDSDMEKCIVRTNIDGYAYGNDSTGISGSVAAVTDGSLTAATSISANVHDGNLDMIVTSHITDDSNDRETSNLGYTIDITSPNDTADGNIVGVTSVNGVPTNSVVMDYVNADVYTTGHLYAVTFTTSVP